MKNMAKNAVCLKNVTVQFGDFTALKNINAVVEDVPESGEFIALLGPSGCGKSTILNLIAGFLKPTSGEVLVDDEVVESPGSDRGMIFQKYSLFPHLTVLKNVLFGLEIDRRASGRSEEESRTQAMAMLERVGLKGHELKYPHQLSGGQQQRVAIARTLVLNPRIILMDEPFSSLDLPTRIVLAEDLGRILHESGTAAIIATHDRIEAFHIVDRLVVMDVGRIVQEGAPKEVLAQPVNAFIAAFKRTTGVN